MGAAAFQLTDGQEAAYIAFTDFVTNPDQEVFVLTGYAGTGKSTLVKHLLDTLPATMRTLKLITQQDSTMDIQLTATTNKAAEALSLITGDEVKTVHSFLGLRPTKNPKTGATKLVPHGGSEIKENMLIIIDEASTIDTNLLELIFDRTVGCKFVFIGDPAQLTPVKANGTPVFNQGYRTAALTEVVRQANGNPIIDLATSFRDTVNGQPFISGFVPDGTHIRHCPRKEFEQLICDEFDRPDWKYSDSKVLAWTNKTVIYYNEEIRNVVVGQPELQIDDYAISNNFLSNKRCKVSTDQTVLITDITPAVDRGVDGWMMEMDENNTAFMPKTLDARKAKLKEAKADEDWDTITHIDNNWIDLRASYSCTINKSQGSTYKKVFIDLDDIKKCNNGNLIARMMYVAVSRASHQVFMTGDLV